MFPRFEQQLQQRRQRLERNLNHYLAMLPAINTQLATVINYGVLSGGKRLRALLLYSVGDCLQLPFEQLDAPATAVECLHAYTLLHDDLPAMDNSPLRRGKPTAHIKFGEGLAILAGDALQAIAFSILSQPFVESISPSTQLAMLQELAATSHGLCHGQALDLQVTSATTLLPETLTQIHYYKTALLIRCAVRLAVFAASPPILDQLPDFDQFSTALGLAFQLQDDILDVTTDTQQLGKPQGHDQQCGKAYWHAANLTIAKQQLQQLHQTAFQNLKRLPYNTLPLQIFADYLQNRVY